MQRTVSEPGRGVRGAAAVAALATVLAATQAIAQTESGGAPGEWLSRYAGARTLGLGGAFVATADDPLGVLWNPAGLSGMDQNAVRFETARLFEDTSINGFSLAVPGSRLPSFGVSMLSLHSGSFQKTDELNNSLGDFTEGETAYLFTMAKGITPRVALGANLKLIQQTVESFNGGGVGFDLGATMAVTPDLRVGASVQNIGGPSVTLRNAAETYPMQIRAGFAYGVLGGRGLITGELDQSDGPGMKIHGGTEYWIQPTLALRVGLDDTRGTGGFSYRFAPQYQVDYGVADHPLGMTHRIGLAYRFGGFFASSKAEPETFSPTGEHAVTKISLNARTKADPDTWALELHDKSDAVVRRFGGQGQPPSHVEWDGKDETGLPLADGTYRYVLTVKDRAGRVVRSSAHAVVLSTNGPQGEVPMVPIQ